ncbi:MAG TPA: hypothetical protein VFI90_11675 [Rubrobacter sp.]|nr:hypothetical protein [Rubrobacter sp.]
MNSCAPLVNYYQRTRDGRAVKISDFLTAGRFHRMEQEVLNTRYQAVAPPSTTTVWPVT